MSGALPAGAGSAAASRRARGEAAAAGQHAEPDYVLVDQADRALDPGAKAAAGGDKSPAPVPVELEVPSGEPAVGTPSPGLELQLDTEALAAWRDRNAADKANSVNTDRTDYSGLNDGDSSQQQEGGNLQKALEEANQQHQWAMEAVITGWESEKADLLLKLRDMTESRDTLEAELRHREGSFAGLLEGILDSKLDQMLQLLQEHGSAQGPASARGSPDSPAALYSQPTVRKAQQVVRDLQALLDVTQRQQAAVEARVSTMQSAVLQLLPEAAGGAPRARRALLPEPAPQPGRLARARAALGRSAAGVGSACTRARGFLAEKAPKAARAAGSLASAAVATPARFAGRQAAALNAALQARGLRTEHAAAAAGALAGVLATTLLIKGRGGSSGGSKAADEWAGGSMREIEVMGPETAPEGEGAVEVVLNGRRAARRAGGDEPALVIAWSM